MHRFGPPAIGTVDFPIPSALFADGEETHTSDPFEIGSPPKFVVCGPHRGFYQYAVRGPASAEEEEEEEEEEDLTATVSPDHRRLTVSIDPP